MAKRRRKTKSTTPRRRKAKGMTLTDDQKLQLLSRNDIDESLKKKILNA